LLWRASPKAVVRRSYLLGEDDDADPNG
jgi:hypothetical protein